MPGAVGGDDMAVFPSYRGFQNLGMIDRVDDIVRVEFAAVMEDHIVAQIELDDRIAFPFPARCQQWLELAGLEIIEHQAFVNVAKNILSIEKAASSRRPLATIKE